MESIYRDLPSGLSAVEHRYGEHVHILGSPVAMTQLARLCRPQTTQPMVSQLVTDLYRQLHPDEQTFSWWDYRGGAFHRKHGLRIDFLLGTEAIASSLLTVATDREFRKKQDGLTASDHAPVIAVLDEA